MGNTKSHAEDILLNLVIETLADGYALLSSSTHLTLSKDFQRDVDYLTMRFRDEGLSFLTVTLPRLGDWCDKWIWGHTVERVEGFKPYDGLFPCFLRPFWIFLSRSRACGIDQHYADVYRFLRTLLHGMKKLNVPSSPAQVADKLASFLSIEEEIASFVAFPTPVLHRAQLLCEEFTAGYTPTCERPRHGPGAVAGGERALSKWLWSHLYESVHAEWPYWDFLYPVRSVSRETPLSAARNHRLQLASCAREYRSLERHPEPCARLLFVPKDSRGPRVISCEPKELMYLQQGVATHLMSYIERHSFTKGHVNFVDQSINGRLALESSRTLEWSTLDLSDASDRVTVELVRFLFPERVTRKWLALRSTATLLPDGRRIPLTKFAPMGSALCFPIESLVFWALAVATVWELSGDRVLALNSVYVYGDDIIVKTGYERAVSEALSQCSLKVNTEKSFGGEHPFRESCGVDAFRGFDVTPLRIRKLPPLRPSDGDGLTAYVKYASNSLPYFPRRFRYLASWVEGIVGRKIPKVPFPQPFLSFVTPTDHWSHCDFSDLRWNPESCYHTSRQLVLKNRKRSCEFGGWKRLQSDLITRPEGDPSQVVERNSTRIGTKRVNVTYLGYDREA